MASKGEDCLIEWVGRDMRFGEKLATPDTSIAEQWAVLITETLVVSRPDRRAKNWYIA